MVKSGRGVRQVHGPGWSIVEPITRLGCCVSTRISSWPVSCRCRLPPPADSVSPDRRGFELTIHVQFSQKARRFTDTTANRMAQGHLAILKSSFLHLGGACC